MSYSPPSLQDSSPVADAAPLAERVRAAMRDVPDFPRPGILFKDITPLLSDPPLFAAVIEYMARQWEGRGIDVIAGIESRGFIFAAPLALRLGCAFLPVRKPGKLPFRTVSVEYALEYGTDRLEAHEDGLVAGARVLIVDDVLATGGTANATVQLVQRLGGAVAGAAFLLELSFLKGAERLTGIPVDVLVRA
jgi:adenine phosphoribosyltransferase